LIRRAKKFDGVFVAVPRGGISSLNLVIVEIGKIALDFTPG
jgi:hypothetical protein